MCICVYVHAFTFWNLSFTCPNEICTCVSLLYFMWVCLCVAVFKCALLFYVPMSSNWPALRRDLCLLIIRIKRGTNGSRLCGVPPGDTLTTPLFLRFLGVCNQIQGPFGSPSWCWVCLYAVDISLTGGAVQGRMISSKEKNKNTTANKRIKNKTEDD